MSVNVKPSKLSPLNAPKPPVQIFPNPVANEYGHVTATAIRELRADILEELEEDTPRIETSSWSRARIALWILLGVSLGALALIWRKESNRAGIIAPQASCLSASSRRDQEDAYNATKASESLAAHQLAKVEAISLNTTTQLAEIELIATLTREDSKFNSQTALARLKPYINAAEKKTREAAALAIKPIIAQLENDSRNATLAAAERAQIYAEICKALEAHSCRDAESQARLAMLREQPDELFHNEMSSRLAKESAEKIIDQWILPTSPKRVILQNGSSPTIAYTDGECDQITDYHDNTRKTDIGVSSGLKVGACGGLQRVLLHFNGLKAAIGEARICKAYLELYQIDSPKSLGAVLALFRIKRHWALNKGSWLCYDTAKNLQWAVPGAVGDADIENNEEACLTLDGRQNVWRSFDITVYIQDALAGKTEDNGLLLRVINSEPNYCVRFYPETDLDAYQDKKLRPRLILQLE